MSEFKEGDIVKLKSGGPKMTVVASGVRGHIPCQWFAGSKLDNANFRPDTLVHVPDEKPVKGKE